MTSSEAIELVNLTKRFGTTVAVDGINLKVPQGSYCCLLGPSGCGKTTILRMIAGHESPSSGAIRIGGRDVQQLPPVKRGTAMVFQNYALFPHLNLMDNVAFSLKMRGMGRMQRREKAMSMLARMQIEHLAERMPAEISGGQQQRVALARALINEPRVLLLDEPLSAIDEFLRLQMRSELKRLQQEMGITFVHVTHAQLEAIALADLLVVMNHGKIAQAADVRTIYNRPRNAYVAQFMGGQNVLQGEVEEVRDSLMHLRCANGARFALPAGENPPPAGTMAFFSVRRDKMELVSRRSDSCRSDEGGYNRLCGRVKAIEYQGTHVKVTLNETGVGEIVTMIDDHRFDTEPVACGDSVTVHWSPEAAHMLEGGMLHEEQPYAETETSSDQAFGPQTQTKRVGRPAAA
jgi:putative spermidine/putrescine transport system ATP-binding protein